MNGNLKNLQSLTGKIKSFKIDTTLTKKGMCAESKAVGDALAAKVNISDIIDDLLSVAGDKPLSANQGRLLKKLIDEIDPHYAENVLYNDTNVKDALDKVSKAENIDYDGDKSVQGAIDEVSRTLGYTVTSKNYLPNLIINNTQYGIDCIVNSNKSVTLNGTNTSSGRVYNNLVGIADKGVYEEIKGLKDDVDYIISGCVGGSENTYGIACVQLHSDGTTSSVDCLDGEVTFTHRNGDKYRCYIFAQNGVPLNNITLFPMIRKASEDATYEPYVADVQTRLDNIGAIVVDETKAITATTGTVHTLKTITNLPKGVYLATLRILGVPNSYVNATIMKNNVELNVNVSNTTNNQVSPQANVMSIINIDNSSDVVEFTMFSGSNMTNREGQKIKMVRIA